MNHEHRWQRLRDDALFCECGEVRYVPPMEPVRPTVYPVPAPWPPDRQWPPNTTVPTITSPNTVTYTPNTIDYPNVGRMIVYGSRTSQGGSSD